MSNSFVPSTDRAYQEMMAKHLAAVTDTHCTSFTGWPSVDGGSWVVVFYPDGQALIFSGDFYLTKTLTGEMRHDIEMLREVVG